MIEKKGPDSITLTYDLLKWAIPTLSKFPRDQKFLLGDRIENHILDVLELLISANYTRNKIDYLRKANLKIEMLRFLWRLSQELKYINTRQYEFAGTILNNMGNLVGGWIKQQKVKDETIRQSLSSSLGF